PQDDSRATYTKPFTKEDGQIDWRRPAIEIGRRIRAFNPWPGCYTTWQGKQLKIIAAVPLTGINVSAQSGQVVNLGQGNGLGIGTGDGVLNISELQLEGKRAVSAGDFLRGQRNFIGSVLPS
ncbi:MAG: methionyl-tRNA formyltransferase, partial [Dehalococcoidales bacterium]|nr:methionyl-tRNA formyltransferase [Dehalococcoidales bacterium]